MISWMQSLSDLTRTRLLRLLDQQELTVMELCAVLQLPQSTVSRHLKTLADDGWVVSRRTGPSNHYSLPIGELENSRLRLWELVKEQTAADLTTVQDESRLEEVLLERQSRSQTFFSSAAERWDGLRTELFGKKLDAWTLAALMPSDWQLVDLGCGNGELLTVIAPMVQRVVGVDSSDAMLKAAQSRTERFANVQLWQADLKQLPLPDAGFDAAIMSIVLPYVDEPERVFSEAARITRVGGRLVLIDLQRHDRTEYRRELNHTWLGFEKAQIEAWLERSSWSIVRYDELAPQSDAQGPNLFMCVATKI